MEVFNHKILPMKKVLLVLAIALGTVATFESCTKDQVSDETYNLQSTADEDHDKDEEEERPN